MTARSLTIALLACAASLASVGCHAPGKPKLETESRPDQVLDFPTLYKQNCAACHGDNGQHGAAISLANPVYLATAGVDNIQRITAAGVPGTSMPPFGKAAGGMLTDQQIAVLAKGLVTTWGRTDTTSSLPYASSTRGDATRGQAAYTASCASCHGADGSGNKATHTGSIIDPSYLALISDQGLRSIIIAGHPDQAMPSLSDQQTTDIVIWITSHRIATPGQPYKQHP